MNLNVTILLKLKFEYFNHVRLAFNLWRCFKTKRRNNLPTKEVKQKLYECYMCICGSRQISWNYRRKNRTVDDICFWKFIYSSPLYLWT